MNIRRFLVLFVSLALFAAACSDDDPNTLTVGDTADDAASAVADASAPAELDLTTTTGPVPVPEEIPSTTAPWEDTLAEYPLLTVLDETDGVGIGRSQFVLVDDENNIVFSGQDELPQFLVGIDAWWGVNNYIEFTIATANVELVDGQPEGRTCRRTWTHLSETQDGSFLRIPNQLPEVRNTGLAWDDEGCGQEPPIEFDVLFDGPVEFEVIDNGFLLTGPDGASDGVARFQKLDPPPPAPVAPSTTIFVDTTTTTSTRPDVDN